MSVTSIPGDVAASTLQSLNTAASLDKQAKGTPAASDQTSSHQAVQPSTVDPNANHKVPSASKPSTDAGSNGSHKQPARAMSHIVETYNLQGKVRIKFVDSHNNVIYQIPSEMVAKMEDQMKKPEAATNTKG